MERRMRMGVDWSDLPQEIIEYISKKLTIYADYLRFRYVCRNWNSSLPKSPLHLPPQLPWLMLSHNSFFDISNNKIHRLNLRRCSQPTRICGSSHGWLVILKQTSELTLFNPITRATLSLPSLSLPLLVEKLFCYNNDNNLPDESVHYSIKVVLSSNPSLGDDDFVAFLILNRRDFLFCKKGYDSWLRLRVSQNNHKWIDAVYKNGSFYVTSINGTIAVCDVEVPRVSFLDGKNIIHNFNYLKDFCYTVFAGEDILLVQRYREPGISFVRFLIFKMNRNGHKREEIQTLDQHSVFIGKNYSFYCSAADYVGCRPNCIYFADDDDFGIYSVLDRCIDRLPCYSFISKCGFGYPFWVTPNPR